MIIRKGFMSLSVCVFSLLTSTGAFAGRSAAIDEDANAALALFYQQNAIHQGWPTKRSACWCSHAWSSEEWAPPGNTVKACS